MTPAPSRASAPGTSSRCDGSAQARSPGWGGRPNCPRPSPGRAAPLPGTVPPREVPLHRPRGPSPTAAASPAPPPAVFPPLPAGSPPPPTSGVPRLPSAHRTLGARPTLTTQSWQGTRVTNPHPSPVRTSTPALSTSGRTGLSVYRGRDSGPHESSSPEFPFPWGRGLSWDQDRFGDPWVVSERGKPRVADPKPVDVVIWIKMR